MLSAPDPVATATTGQLVIQALLTLSLGSVLSAVAAAFLSRRKTKADVRKTEADTSGAEMSAASVLSGSAVALIQPMREELARLNVRVTDQDTAISTLRRSVEESQERERGHVRQLTAYRRWIEKASRLLAERGIPIEPPPHDDSLWPPLPPSPRAPTD